MSSRFATQDDDLVPLMQTEDGTSRGSQSINPSSYASYPDAIYTSTYNDDPDVLSSRFHRLWQGLPASWSGERNPEVALKSVMTILSFIALFSLIFAVPSLLPAISSQNSISIPVPGGRPPPQVFGDKGAVAADHPECSKLGVKVMRDMGGNAVDAAVSTLLCQGILAPVSSGIGGGAFLLVYSKASRKQIFYDGRETAPKDVSMKLFEASPNTSKVGGLAVGVPGELRALEMMHMDWGKLNWKDLVMLAVPLAEEATVGSHLAKSLQLNKDAISESPSLLALFSQTKTPKSEDQRGSAEASIEVPGARDLATSERRDSRIREEKHITQIYSTYEARRQKGGNETSTEIPENDSGTKLLQKGDKYRNPALAETLRRVAERGADAVYIDLAANLSKDIQAAGGVMTAKDISSYQPVKRTPIVSSYRGMKVLGAPLPSAGGASVGMALNVLEGYRLRRRGRNKITYSYLVETLKHVFARRMLLADSDFEPSALRTVKDMLTKRRARQIRRNIDWRRTYDPRHYARGLAQFAEDSGTTHVSILDKDGLAVSATSTIHTGFGAIFASSSGIILNNQMDDFTLSLERKNMYGLYPSRANRVEGGKRPLSSMSPTIILYRNNPYANVGGSGGPRIITGTLQTILNAADWGDSLDDAINAPRFHHQLIPNTLVMESINGATCELDGALQQKSVAIHGTTPWSYWTGICDALKGIGHNITGSNFVGYVNGVLVPDVLDLRRDKQEPGRRVAFSDPRKFGRADAY